jgi:hypothetical protein
MDFQEKSKKGHAKAAVHNTPSISYYFVVLTFLDTFFCYASRHKDISR